MPVRPEPNRRRDAEPRHVAAQEQPRLDVAPHALAIVPDEPVGAGEAGTFEQRENRDRVAAGLEIEMRKARELLGRRERRVHRQTAGRKAILLQLARRTEIARAEIGEPVAMQVGVITRGGLLSGRHNRSPAPVAMARPSESWISGRQSGALARFVSENQYMLVSGAMPSRATLRRRNSRASTSPHTPLPLCQMNR